MNYTHQIQVGTSKCYIAFGEASWDNTTPVTKFGWLDRNGHRSRPGGEVWKEAFLQQISEAVQVGFITPKEGLQAVTDGMP